MCLLGDGWRKEQGQEASVGLERYKKETWRGFGGDVPHCGHGQVEVSAASREG